MIPKNKSEQKEQLLDNAIANLPFKPIFKHEDQDLQLVCLLKNTPPLKAHWHKGKQVHLLAVDVNGHFFLRLSSGAIRYWNHQTRTGVTVSKSITDFICHLSEAPN